MRNGWPTWSRILLIIGVSIGIAVSAAYALVQTHESRPHASTPTLREYDSLRRDITQIKTDVEFLRHNVSLQGTTPR